MLVTTIGNGCQLQQLFREYGRENYFSPEGFDALYDYLDKYSNDIGEPFKVDVIAMCGEFTEYESYRELYNDYSYSYNNSSKSFDELETANELDDFKEWLNDSTIVIEVTDYKDDVIVIIIQCF